LEEGVKGILDMFSVWFWQKYAHRPLHLFGGVGLGLMLVSFIAGLDALYGKIFLYRDLSTLPGQISQCSASLWA